LLLAKEPPNKVPHAFDMDTAGQRQGNTGNENSIW